MRLLFSIVVALLLLLCVAQCSALQQPVQNVGDLCYRIGVYSGCSGCIHGAGGTCDWCVDPNDESGRNLNVFGPICVPSGKCGADDRRVKAAANLCPTIANSSMESHYKGIKMEKPSSVIFSSSHNSVYCNFTRQPWLLDRTVRGSSDECNTANAHAVSGVGAELGMIAGRCFDNAPALTYRMKECLKEVQSFACTYNCREYGVASVGYKKSTCDRFLNVCGGFLDSDPRCVLNRFKTILDFFCAADDAPRTTSVTAIRPTSRWEFDYGLDKKYDLPVDCELSDWSDWSTCSEPCDTGSQFRIKSVAKQAAYGGDPCEGSQHETQDCNTMACKCTYSDASWSTCSNDCGIGTKSRTRDLDLANSIGYCDATLSQTTDCVGSGCCTYSLWVDGTCTGPCDGTGTMTQTRTITRGDASFCLDPLEQIVSCPTGSCNTPHFAGSQLLDSAKKNQLVSWTSTQIASSGKLWTLCYGANQGTNAANFRLSCLNKGPTLTVAKESRRNGIYGGYTSLSWTFPLGSNAAVVSSDSTVFTFRLTDRVDGTTNDFKQCSGTVITDHSGYGPYLNSGAFYLFSTNVYLGDAGGCATADYMEYLRFEVYYLA